MHRGERTPSERGGWSGPDDGWTGMDAMEIGVGVAALLAFAGWTVVLLPIVIYALR